MSSPEDSAPPVQDILSAPFKPSSTSVETPVQDTLSAPFNTSSTSVGTPVQDILSASFKTSSTSVETPVQDTLSAPFNISSTSVETTMAHSNLAAGQPSSPQSSSGAEFTTPTSGVINPDKMDTSPYPQKSPELGTPSLTEQALRHDTAVVTERFPSSVKIENEDLEEGEIMQSVEQDPSSSKEPENVPSSRMDWGNTDNEWHSFKPLPELPPSQLFNLYPATRGLHLSQDQLVVNARTQLTNAFAAAQAEANAPPKSLEPMHHMMLLKDIKLMKNRPDIFIRCRHIDTQGQVATLEAGSVAKPKVLDHSLRCAIDAGKRGQPTLRIVLFISPDPDVAIEQESFQDRERNKVFTLRFPTGNYAGKHAITNFVKVPAAADIQALAQATIQHRGPVVKTWTLKFKTDFCFAEGFQEVDSLSKKYSAELFNILKTLQTIRSSAEVELSFMLKGSEDLIENNVLVPFEHAVNTELPQFFPYRHLRSKKPIIDLNMENILSVGENMYQDKGELKLQPWPEVLAFDDDDHYTITTAVGAIREHQYQVLDEQVLSQLYHKMYMVKPLAIEGKKNSMYQAYIVLAKGPDSQKFPAPAEGTNYRLEIKGREDKPEKEWQGTVVLHTPKELQQYGCHFDFVIYVERPRGGRLPKIHHSFRDMALRLNDGYSLVRLHTAHADVVSERPLLALRKIRDGAGPLRDAIIGRQRPGQDHRPIYREVGGKAGKFLDTCKILEDHWSLNQGQRAAIHNALHNTLSLIQGPPGTGKTKTIGSLIWLNVIAGNRVLACAASNKAVDGIASKLVNAIPAGFYPHLRRFPIVRMHLPTSERQHLTEMGTRLEIANLVRTEEDLETAAQSANMEDLAKLFRAQSFKEEHWDMPEYSLAQAILTLARNDGRKYEDRYDPADTCRDFRRILALYNAESYITKEDESLFHVQYKTMVHRVFDLSYIVIATCNNSASADLVSAYRPDVIIIDEASQAAEIDTIIPIGNNLRAKRVVLVGDHKQLAPVVSSERQNEFRPQRYLSLFERLLRLDYPYSALTEQYRATPDIMDFYATHIYDGKLTTAKDFREHPTSQLVRQWAQRRYNLSNHEAIFIDVPNGVQEVEPASTSLQNTAEAFVVVRILHSLLVDNAGIKAEDIGVIVLYKAQRTKISVELQKYKNEHLNEVHIEDIETNTEISTVDSYQGSERNIIISNFVITSILAKDNQGASKFALDDRRLCVSMSRARYGLILVGNAEALENARPRKAPPNFPNAKISLVPTYHSNRGSLACDSTKDDSPDGQARLAKRNADRQARQPATDMTMQGGASKSAAATRELPPGAAQLYQLKHRQARANVKRTAEEGHSDDRGGKRPQQDYGLQRVLRESLLTSQPGQGSFVGSSAPGTMGITSPLPPPPPGFLASPAPTLPLPPLPGATGLPPPTVGRWDIRPAQTQQFGQPPQQGSKSGDTAPPNQQTARGSTGRGTNQGSAGRGSGPGPSGQDTSQGPSGRGASKIPRGDFLKGKNPKKRK